MMTLLALATVLGSTEIGVRAFASAPPLVPLYAQVPIGDPSEDEDGMEDEEEDEDDEDDEAPWS